MTVEERNLRESKKFREFDILRIDEVIKRSRESRQKLLQIVKNLETLINQRYGGK